MELHVLTAADKGLLADHFRARAKMFTNWPAPNYLGGMEADIFDAPIFDPVWFSAVHEGQTLAVGRLIPADGPFTMVEQAWPEGIQTPLPGKNQSVELHRIGAIPGLDKTLMSLAVGRIKHGIAEYVLNMGRTHMFFLTPQRVAETTLSNLDRHGSPIEVDGAPFFIVSGELDRDANNLLGDQLDELELALAGEPRKAAS